MISSENTQKVVVSVVDTLDAFVDVEDQWRTLVTESGASFFLSWEWHYTWWQVYSTRKDRLSIVQFHIGNQLVGILPMYSRKQGLLGLRTLQFLGTGEARADEVATEYLDVIVHSAHRQAVATAALDWMASCLEWSKVELRFMLDEAALVEAYRARDDLYILEKEVGFRYRSDLSLDENEHLSGLGKSRTKRLERSRRALKRDGGLTQYSVNSTTELNHAFQQLAELNHERQAHKNRKSVFASDKFNRFHRALFELVYARGLVNIHQFKLNHKLLAVIYCFYDETTCYYYQSGFVQRMANKYMPLSFAHLAEMQRNRENGKHYYDLMRAEPPSYKEDFGCETTPMLTTFLFCSKGSLKRFNSLKTARRSVVRMLRSVGIQRT